MAMERTQHGMTRPAIADAALGPRRRAAVPRARNRLVGIVLAIFVIGMFCAAIAGAALAQYAETHHALANIL
jgi:hypothetical protein